ncbi:MULTISPECIES: SDR family NAD(P)-dependent oxidoreductase [unclassified Cryobacterium]|uniref:SDR family NAD(P)-dependent oxidoreductase n=1 Tax=unclassified Cryobacterium TaxID=2649013 RepID=UPI001446D56C|nr:MULTISPECIES: SDR family oxidoreductase [unclassified Cryobacterium]
MNKLTDKVAVITGGTSGIGLASVELFVAEGAKVVVGDIQDDLGAALEKKHDGNVVYVHTDVTDDAAVEALVATAVDKFGKLDVMFNNAGAAGDPSAMVDLSADGFDKTLALLTRSVASGHKHAARQFQKQGTGGSIISTASAAGIQGGWSSAGYTIAKHAVVGLVRQATAELAPLGIRSNAIAPGIIMTPIMARSFGIAPEKADEFEALLSERLATAQPIGRVGRPEDIAEAAVFLASDSSSFVTGVTLSVDGGATVVTQSGFAATAAQAAADFQAER